MRCEHARSACLRFSRCREPPRALRQPDPARVRMMQPEYSLSLDAVICRRCNVVSPAVDETCPYCGADRQGAIFTSVADTNADAAASDDRRDFVDLRDTGWLTRLVRRRMVTSYPSLVEPGDALPLPERRPARKGLVMLVSGVVAGVAAGGYFYTQSDAQRTPTQTVSAAGTIGNASSSPQTRDDADRHALTRRQDDEAQTWKTTAAGASASAAAVPAANGAGGMSGPSLARVEGSSSPAVASRVVESQAASGKGAKATEVASASDSSLSLHGEAASKATTAKETSAADIASSNATSSSSRTVAASKASSAKDSRTAAVASASASLASSPADIASTAKRVPELQIPAMAAESPKTREASRQAVADAINSASRHGRAASDMATGAVVSQTPSHAVSTVASASQSRSSPTSEAAHDRSVATPVASPSAGARVASALPSVTSPPAVDSNTAATSNATASQSTVTSARTPATAATSAARASSIAPNNESRSAPTITAQTGSSTAATPTSDALDKTPANIASPGRPIAHSASAHEAPSSAEARTVAAVRQALANRDLAAARRYLRALAPIQSRSAQTQQLAADVSRQERARDSAMASARSCAANHDPACVTRNARRAVALDPRNAQAQALLKHAMTVQADANTAYFRKASALPAPVVPSMTFDGRWSVAPRSASGESHRSDASKSYTLFGWGVPTVSKGRGDAH